MSTRRTASSQKKGTVAEGVRLLFFCVIPDWHGGLVERR